jgi:hypothetical protein
VFVGSLYSHRHLRVFFSRHQCTQLRIVFTLPYPPSPPPVCTSAVSFVVQGLKSPLPEKRQGVCLGLSEVIGASTRKQIEDFLPVLIPAVQDALCDPR